MSKIVLASVGAGLFVGYYFLPESFISVSDNILVFGLTILLFFIGVDIGLEGKAIENIKKVGLKIIIFPISVIVGTYSGSVLASLFLPISTLDSLIVSSGFGWYSLAPIMIAEKSAELSAIAFIHNVFREFFAILLIPFVAKHIGYVETTSLPGAAAMDVCLPVVEKSTTNTVAIYAFISGLVISMGVPILVGLFLQLY